jgi:hypothetical protein
VAQVAAAAPGAAQLVFRHEVLKLLRDAGLVDEDRIALLLSWRHTGFSVDSSVTVAEDDDRGLERLARYLLRPPVSLERLSWAPGAESLTYRVKAGHDGALPLEDRRGDAAAETSSEERFDPLEFVARVVTHIPDARRHLVHYYGWYANAARAKRRRDAVTVRLEGEHVEGEMSSTRDGAGPEGLSAPTGPGSGPERSEPEPAPPMSADEKTLRRRWADLIRRIFEVDPLVCAKCGGAMRVLAFVTNRESVRGILRHLEKRRAVAPEAVPSEPRPPPPPRVPAAPASG